MFGIENFLWTQSSYFIQHRSYVNLCIGAVVLSAAVFSLKSTRDLRLNRMQVLVWMLYAFGFLSLLWTRAPEDARDQWHGSIHYVIVYVVLAPLLTRSPGALKDGFRWTMIIGIPVLFLSAFYCEWGTRGMVLAEPVFIGDALWTEAFPLAVAQLATTVGVVTIVAELRIPMALVLRVAVLGVAIYIAFLSQSRGQVLVLVFVSLLLNTISNGKADPKHLLFAAVIGFAICTTVYFVAQEVDLWRWDRTIIEGSLSTRQGFMSTMLQHWVDGPTWGLLFGLGTSASFHFLGIYPHNVPVEILTELGILGFAIYAAILMLSANNSFCLSYQRQGSATGRRDAIVLTGLLLSGFLLSCKQGALLGTEEVFFFAICLSQQRRFAEQTRKVLARAARPRLPAQRYPHAEPAI
jgi:hypothetical protein